MFQEQQELTREELKILHYRQKVNDLENALADARVELTIVSQELEKAQRRVAELEESVVQPLGEDELQEETGE